MFCLAASASAADEEPASLVQLLETLRATTGENIIYSSSLVEPSMRVPANTTGLDIWARARQALASFGLELRSVSPRNYVVVRAAPKVAFAPPMSDVAAGTLKPQEVSVYASRYELGRDFLAEPRLVNASDIEDIPGTREDALRAVRTVPGVATNLSARPYIRGSSVNDVLVQFDGVPLADPFHLKNFQSLLSAFDPEAVERIEVFSSGFPVRYGTRSGGVIDLQPRAMREGYEHSFGISSLSVDAASVGRAERWPLDWLVTIRHGMPDEVLKPINSDEGEPRFTDTLGRLRWQLESGSTVTLGWLLLDDRVDLSSPAVDERARARYRDEYAWIAYEQSLGERLRGRTVLSGSWAERTRGGVLDAPGISMQTLDEARESSGIELRSNWSFQQSDRQSWDVGLELTRTHGNLRYLREGFFSAPVAASFGRASDTTLRSAISPKATTYAVSVAARRRWSALEAELGVRLDGQDYRDTGLRNQWSPRLNVRYDLTPEWRAYGSWGQFTQAQRVDEWRTEDAQVRPDSAALAVHTVVGLSYTPANEWRVSLEAYRKYWSKVTPYHDNLFTTLSLLPDLQPDRRLISPESSEAAGVEFVVRRALTSTIELSAAYAYAKVSDAFADRDDVPRSWEQPHAVSIGLTWNEGPWRATGFLGWHQGWPRTLLNADTTTRPRVDFDVGMRNSARWTNYVTADLSASWTHSFARSDLVAWLEVMNVMDRRNACCMHLASPVPPQVVPAVEEDYWSRQTVNVGVTWRIYPQR